MKNLILFVFICVLSLNTQAQKKEKKNDEEKVEFTIDSTSVLTLDSTIKALYNVISGEKKEKRNFGNSHVKVKRSAQITFNNLIAFNKYMSQNY